MVVDYRRAAAALCAALVSAAMAATSLDAAPKRKAAPKKKTAAAAKKAAPKAGTVPRDRAVREFNAVYQDPPGSKKLKVVHTGKVRRYTETRGSQEVPAQAHRLAVTVKLADCGITMRDVWEVYFYKLETEWIFLDIMQVGSAQITRTKKKHPVMENAAAKKIIADALMNANPDLRVKEITILGKKPAWRLCTPEYRVTSKIAAELKNDIYNTVTAYECLMVSTLALENGSWTHKKSGCMYRGKEVPDCHIGTMCRELSTESAIPAPTDAETAALLREAFNSEYGLRKNNIVVETFDIIKKHPLENFRKKVPCTILARFVMDENRTIPADGASPARREKVRAVYECIVTGHLSYSLTEKKWTGVIESCCTAGTENCGTSCSNPDRGCRRLGEK